MIQKRIQLAGNYQGWLPTGIFLRAGQIAQISATGTISFGPFGSWFFSPSGQQDRPAGANAPAPGLTANSLVARAGGEVQFIGASGAITADADGQLELAANDDWSADNGGYWNITIRLG